MAIDFLNWETRDSHIAGRIFTLWATKEALTLKHIYSNTNNNRTGWGSHLPSHWPEAQGTIS